MKYCKYNSYVSWHISAHCIFHFARHILAGLSRYNLALLLWHWCAHFAGNILALLSRHIHTHWPAHLKSWFLFREYLGYFRPNGFANLTNSCCS